MLVSGMAARPPAATGLRVHLEVSGEGRASVGTGLSVLDELLVLLARASGFDIEVEGHAGGGEAEVEAVAHALGVELADALGRPGSLGLGSGTAPADEALAQVALDASGRPLVVSNVDLTAAHLGGLRGDLLARFLEALADAAGLTVHVRLLHGEDTLHVVDAVAKALGLALGQACRPARG
jgi:imidazoleglycerol-phosphate dehydratase